jgi:hypothetical protein
MLARGMLGKWEKIIAPRMMKSETDWCIPDILDEH